MSARGVMHAVVECIDRLNIAKDRTGEQVRIADDDRTTKVTWLIDLTSVYKTRECAACNLMSVSPLARREVHAYPTNDPLSTVGMLATAYRWHSGKRTTLICVPDGWFARSLSAHSWTACLIVSAPE